MILDANSLTFINQPEELRKGFGDKIADSPQEVHKELPPGGKWVTIRGHHIYVKDGKIVAGAVPHVWKAGKFDEMPQADIKKHQGKLDEGARGYPKKEEPSAPASEGKKTGKSRQKLGGGGRVTAKAWVENMKESAAKHKNGAQVAGWTDKQWSEFDKKRRAEGKPPIKAIKEYLDNLPAKGKGTNTDAKKATGKGKVGGADSAPSGRSKRSAPAASAGTRKTTKPKKEGVADAGVQAKPRRTRAGIVPTVPTDKKAAPATKPSKKAGQGNAATSQAGNAKPERKSRAGGGAVAPSEAKGKPAPKKAASAPKKSRQASKQEVADIRHEAQAGRSLAYDVGDKVGGARKDTFQKNFTADPTAQNLEALEKVAPEVAQKMCVKKNILPPVDFAAEHKNGVEIDAALLKQMIFDRIAPKPQGETPEDRAAYLMGINKLHRILTPIKTWDELRNTISELGNIAHAGKRYNDAKSALDRHRADPSRYSYFNTELYQSQMDKGAEAKKMLDFGALGEKLESFFTKSDSRIRTFQTIRDKKASWDTYFKPSDEADASEGRGATRGAGRHKWERMAVSEHQRTGGRETPVKKPEDMVKQFGMRGVEFGNWVDDASGLYHLKRASEAFHDLADILGVDDKDISLNGRLSMAFGARGKAGAVAHYEPDRKVINMTKHGGAGSLAHEWGHAMDNILYAYSHGSPGSLALASDGVAAMGDQDPELKRLYGNLMDAIRKPPAGSPGGVRKVAYDTAQNSFGNYYPEMRRDIQGGMSMEDAITKFSAKYRDEFDRSMRAIDSMRSRYSAKDMDKRVQQAQRELNKKLKELPHRVAYELKNRNGWTSEHIKGEISMPTGQSEYYTRMQEFDGGGKPYYAQGAEMFARVFESLIEDKLTAKKRKNNYLVWDTKTSKGNKDAPFPIGEERTNMHAAMDELLKYLSKGKVLKKALEMELVKSFLTFDYLRALGAKVIAEDPAKAALAKKYDERLAAMKMRRDPEGIASGITERSAYNVDHETDPSEVLYIPVNRLKMVYQTDEATDWDKVRENADKMRAGEALKPVEIGYDYDVHDGHHRWIATKTLDYTHVPCIVKGKDEAERKEAIARYREMWKSLPTDDLRKSIIPDPAGNSPFGDGMVMYRGIGQKELDFINAHGYVQSKGKGNDDDKEKRETCFTNLFQQALGYAVSNYTLYGEEAAYVIALPKPPWIREDEHGELISDQPVPFGVGVVIPIPNPEAERGVFQDGESLQD